MANEADDWYERQLPTDFSKCPAEIGCWCCGRPVLVEKPEKEVTCRRCSEHFEGRHDGRRRAPRRCFLCFVEKAKEGTPTPDEWHCCTCRAHVANKHAARFQQGCALCQRARAQRRSENPDDAAA
jgi:hypothetical protein